jgi:hypothetical protein
MRRSDDRGDSGHGTPQVRLRSVLSGLSPLGIGQPADRALAHLL